MWKLSIYPCSMYVAAKWSSLYVCRPSHWLNFIYKSLLRLLLSNLFAYMCKMYNQHSSHNILQMFLLRIWIILRGIRLLNTLVLFQGLQIVRTGNEFSIILKDWLNSSFGECCFFSSCVIRSWIRSLYLIACIECQLNCFLTCVIIVAISTLDLSENCIFILNETA